MKTYKEKTIEACKELADKYRNPEGHTFFSPEHCPMCQIYYLVGKKDCRGCFMADIDGDSGCVDFYSYKKAQDSVENFFGSVFMFHSEPTYEFLIRANFFENIIAELKKIPEERFTPLGWKYFKEISRGL